MKLLYSLNLFTRNKLILKLKYQFLNLKLKLKLKQFSNFKLNLKLKLKVSILKYISLHIVVKIMFNAFFSKFEMFTCRYKNISQFGVCVL